ncbi:hypothetical protein AVEN_118373-1 [Araneus ventricosus]|uniref:Uncharacterized protein n=1 Tax=Araneus ventricosus TaxID=182803 RepID=A0A4Y2B7Y9_ARAVE|nr:hypothetical protein AVEN_118373-1 [Araneus ventricosus]
MVLATKYEGEMLPLVGHLLKEPATFKHSGETSVNDRKVKGIGLDRDLSTVSTGSCNCICGGRYSTTRCSAGRITTAINPQNTGLGYRAVLFHCFRKAYYRE